MKSSDARYGESNPSRTYNIMNFPAVTSWVQASLERSSVLFGQEKTLIDEVLGEASQTWVGGSERNRFSLWREEAEGLTVWVMSSKRGTVYELEHPGNPWDGSIPDEDVGKVLRFLARFYLRLEDTAPIRKYGTVIAEADDPLLAEARTTLSANQRPHMPF